MWLSFQGLFPRRPVCTRISKNRVQPQTASCVHTESLTISIPSSNTSLNSSNVFPGCTHALSIIPLIVWHPIIWSILSILSTLIFLFLVLIAHFATRDSLCFSVTGTRIIYDRKFLLDCRNSPLARTPPCCLPQIPGVTVPATHPVGKLQDLKEEAEEEEKETAGKPPLWARFSALFLGVTGELLQELRL